jgi:hypothetical protein
MRRESVGLALMFAMLGVVTGCIADSDAKTAARPIVKGGDNRTGAYDPAPGWWKPAPSHTDGWTWAQVSGLVADSPDRIIVGILGDRNAAGEPRPNSSNYIVVVDGNGDIIENWTQWDTMVAFPHQLYISPYDPERHIWIVDRGGGLKKIHEQIYKFTNDGKQLALRLRDPNPIESQGGPVARDNPHPGPLDFGQASTLGFLPNGDFLLGDGYQNSRIVRYNSKGEFLSEFGSLGSGPGQFDLVHGVAIDREHRIYVSDRDNNRIQVFTEKGEFIEEWPDIFGPTHLHIDVDENIWVMSTTLNEILKFNKNGELLYQFGAYCCTRGGFEGGFSQPHQFTVDPAGNVYVANYFGGYVTKLTPKPGADPGKLIGQGLVLEN